MSDVIEPEPVAAPTAVEEGQGLPQRMAANAFMNYAADAIIGISALILTPLLLHHLGDDAFAVWALAGTVTVYLELFEFGFGSAAVKLIAEDAYRRPREVLITFNTNFFALCVFGALSLVAGLVIAFLAPALFSIPAWLETEAVLAFAILAVTMSISVPLDVIGGALVGHQRYDLLSGANGLSVICLGIGTAVTLVLGGGLVALAVVNTIVLVAMHALRWRMLSGLVSGLRISPSLVRRDRLRESVRLSGWFLGKEVAEVLVYRIDLVVVGVVLGLRAAAVYAVGSKIAMLGRRAVQPVSKLFFPHASSVGGDRGLLSAVLIEGTRATMVVAVPTCIVLAALAQPGIEAWVGTGYGEAATVLVLLALAYTCLSVAETWWYVVVGAGEVRLVALVRIGEAILNLVLSFVLAHRMGPEGVALGTLLAAGVIGLPAAIWCALRSAGTSAGEFTRRALLPQLAPTIGTASIAALVGWRLPAHPVPVVAAGAALMGVYLALYLAVGATASERRRARSLASKTGRILRRAG